MKKGSSTYRENRPIDILAPPPKPNGRRPSLADLPDDWTTAVTEAEEWPYVDPDENGLADPEPDFVDFPSDPDNLPVGIEPFSQEEPWGRMVTETNRNYELFCYYRAQGITRTKQGVATHFGLKRGTIEILASRRNWDVRARAWDDYRERVYTMELLQGVKEMAHEHAEIARNGVQALATAFSAIVEAMADPDERAAYLEEIADLPVRQQLALAQGSARVIPGLMNAERLSRGLPTEISHELQLTETRVTIQTTDDLADILLGLAGPIAVSRSGDPEEEIIEVDG